ncbi:hypothetical protein K402DRAFT_397591, partial [Aulographum hederae CBS 113979]
MPLRLPLTKLVFPYSVKSLLKWPGCQRLDSGLGVTAFGGLDVSLRKVASCTLFKALHLATNRAECRQVC